MGKIICEECKKEYDDTNKVCPNCGYERNKKKNKLKFIVIASFLIIIILIVAVVFIIFSDGYKYNKAKSLYDNKEYSEAAKLFNELSDYEDSSEMYLLCKYEEAKMLMEINEYENAIVILEELGDYEDSTTLISNAQTELQYEKYSNIIDLLTSKNWYYNGGSDLVLNQLSFTKSSANIAQVYFDGNGKHDNGNTDYKYTIDDETISITIGETPLTIEYSITDNNISLGNNEYFTIDEIKNELLGYWKCRFTYGYFEHEYNIYIGENTYISQSANEGFNLAPGDYYYTGPNEGTYSSLIFGGFDFSDVNHAWYWNIIDGKPTIIYFNHVCSETDSLPDVETGYQF